MVDLENVKKGTANVETPDIISIRKENVILRWIAFISLITTLLLAAALVGTAIALANSANSTTDLHITERGHVVHKQNNSMPLATATTGTVHYLDQLYKKSLQELAEMHTIIFVDRQAKNGSGRIVHIAEIELLAGNKGTITTDAGNKIVIDVNGVFDVAEGLDGASRRLLQNSNSTMAVYASTFIPFDSSF